MSAANTAWPGLGFDPAPGDPASVDRLSGSLNALAAKLTWVGETLNKINNSQGGIWTGLAAEKFGAQIGTLPASLKDASDSVTQAKDALHAWWTELNENRPRARNLEQQAVAARSTFESARTDHTAAGKNPDLALAGRTFPDDQSLADAQRRYTAASNHLDEVGARVDRSRAELEAIIKQAESLSGEHEQVARTLAGKVRAAADSKAPPEPGIFSKIGDWFKDNADWITVAASIVGIAAIFFPPLALVAVALSAVALVSHGAKYGMSGLLPPSGKNLGNYLTLGGDLLGVIPGVGAAYKGVTAGVKAARTTKGAVAGTKVGVSTAVKATNTAAKTADPSIKAITTPVEKVATRLGASPGKAIDIADNAQAAAMAAWTTPTAVNAYTGTDGDAANLGTATGNAFTGGGNGAGGKTAIFGTVIGAASTAGWLKFG